MYKDLEGQSKSIIHNCVELAYFMRGAIQYKDFMNLTPLERKIVAEFLTKRMEVEGQRPNPVY